MLNEYYQKLTLEQEVEAYRNSDYDRLIYSQLPLVYKLAMNFVRSIGRLDLLDDAFAIGLLRLVELVRVFDPSKARLSKLCCLGVEQKVRQQVSRIAECGGIKQVVVKNGKIVPTHVACVYDVPVSKSYDAVEITEQPDLRAMVANTMLSKDEKTAIELRCSGLTMSEIAAKSSSNKMRVRRIINRAVQMIREANNVESC